MVEFRKLIGFGKTSFVTSIPKYWINKHNLKKGDLISLDENEDTLIISPRIIDSEQKQEEINLSLDGLDRTSIIYLIRSAYRKGYGVVKLSHKKQTCSHYRLGKDERISSIIHDEIDRLVGVEITTQKENSCIIRSISEPSPKEFDIILRRLFLLLIDASDDLIHGIKENNKDLIGTTYDKHNSISKFASYCLRMINQGKLEDKKNSYFIYHIIANLDGIVDALKYCSRKILTYGKPLKKETIKLLEQITNTWKFYYDLYYKFDLEKVAKLSKNRYEFRANIKNILLNKKIPQEECWILMEMKNTLEVLHDLTEAKMSLSN